MLAADTNFLLRIIVGDDLAQERRAATLMQSNDVWIAKTVLLELNWVLRKTYGFPAADATLAIRELCGLPNVLVEDAAAVNDALGWTSDGLDFADAMHLASRGEADAFVTFDKPLLRFCKKTGIEASEP